MTRRRRLSLAEAQRTGRMAEFVAQAKAEGGSPIGEEVLNELARRLNDGSAAAKTLVPTRRTDGL
jgi:hypothetical protein